MKGVAGAIFGYLSFCFVVKRQLTHRTQIKKVLLYKSVDNCSIITNKASPTLILPMVTTDGVIWESIC